MIPYLPFPIGDGDRDAAFSPSAEWSRAVMEPNIVGEERNGAYMEDFTAMIGMVPELDGTFAVTYSATEGIDVLYRLEAGVGESRSVHQHDAIELLSKLVQKLSQTRPP